MSGKLFLSFFYSVCRPLHYGITSWQLRILSQSPFHNASSKALGFEKIFQNSVSTDSKRSFFSGYWSPSWHLSWKWMIFQQHGRDFAKVIFNHSLGFLPLLFRVPLSGSLYSAFMSPVGRTICLLNVEFHFYAPNIGIHQLAKEFQTILLLF